MAPLKTRETRGLPRRQTSEAKASSFTGYEDVMERTASPQVRLAAAHFGEGQAIPY